MSLGIAFKGPEGVVLAADSRVTLTGQTTPPGSPHPVLLPATYDNATKLLSVKGQNFVGAVTYGTGAIGTSAPRTAHSFVPEFEQELAARNTGRLPVQAFAAELGTFFLQRWQQAGMPATMSAGQDMYFLVGGYDDGEAYGKVFEVTVPGSPTPRELNTGEFGIAWGGQPQFVERLLTGFDPGLPALAQQQLSLSDVQTAALMKRLREGLAIPIPYQFLPLQDSIDLAIFLIRATIQLQTWTVAIRGVGGSIDLATVTRVEGFKYIQQKSIAGERKP
jgi:hypothetical protein